MTIQVSSDTFKNLSPEHKKAIQDVISATFQGQTIEEVGHLSTESACTTACDIAQEVAIAACQAIPFPGNIACVAIVNAAHKECIHAC
jgi:hypothetical protein